MHWVSCYTMYSTALLAQIPTLLYNVTHSYDYTIIMNDA